ncbi:hypothetical protein NAPIS_ORF00302, partial [Vairimorpha apis BRL 01]
ITYLILKNIPTKEVNLDSLPAFNCRKRVLMTENRTQILLTYSALLVIEDFINISCLFSICPVYGSFKQPMAKETKEFYNIVYNEDATILEGSKRYKYLGVTEDNASAVKQETFEKIKNMILVFSELAISVLNYHAVPSTIRNRNSSLIGNYDYILYLLRKERIMVSCIKLGPQLSKHKRLFNMKQITSYEIGKYSVDKRDNILIEDLIKRWIYIMRRYNKVTNKIRSYSVQDVIYNDNTKILVDTKISTDIKINHNKLDIFVLDKKNKEILIVEVESTTFMLINNVLTKIKDISIVSLSNEDQVNLEDLTNNNECEIKEAHIFTMKITHKYLNISYIEYQNLYILILRKSKYHSKHRKEPGITDRIEAYIQSTTLKKTLESISMEYRRGERIAETEKADQQTNVFQGQILV